MNAVEMIGITKVFGKTIANGNVNFFLKKGTIHGLLGENGAGKTTLMNVLYGLYQAEEGIVKLHGKEVSITNPTVAIQYKIGMVHQHFMLVKPFKVLENIMLGMPERKGLFMDEKKVADKITALSKKYNLQVDPYSVVNELSVGQQQRVEILTAIFGGADILILDEPTAVLTPQEADELFLVLDKMRSDGKSIILITHKLEEILAITDEVTVLRDGKLIGVAPVDNTVTKSTLTRMMVGRDVVFDFGDRVDNFGEEVLSVKNLYGNNDQGSLAIEDVTFSIRQSEILGVAGVDGNGQKELCEIIFGLRKAIKGSISYESEDITNFKPKQIINKNISYIPEDRHKTGLAMNMSVKENLIIKHYADSKFKGKILLNEEALKENAERLVKNYSIKVNSIDDLAKDLSGGNQQKVVIAREIDCNPDLIIASQTTRGLDIGATEYIREQLVEQKNKGAAILLVSADLEEIKQISDRIAVMYDGKIMGILDKTASIEEIGLLMAGVTDGGEANAK